MINYPLSTLMAAGLRDICIITTEHDQAGFQRLLGDGSDLGMDLTYVVQSSLMVSRRPSAGRGLPGR